MTKLEEINVLDQTLLDRFVDGELTDDEERIVLKQLDQTTGGWRQCALTFVESRVWQREIHFLQTATPVRVQPASTSIRNRWQNAPVWTGVITASAVVFLAFAVGTYFPRASRTDPLATGQSLQQLTDPVGSLGAYEQLVSSSGLTRSDRQRNHDSIGSLGLVLNSGEQVEVPILDLDRQAANAFLEGTSLLSSKGLQNLNLKRHKVRSRQSYVPVQLEDGRRVVVPMQVFDVVPVDGMAY